MLDDFLELLDVDVGYRFLIPDRVPAELHKAHRIGVIGVKRDRDRVELFTVDVKAQSGLTSREVASADHRRKPGVTAELLEDCLCDFLVSCHNQTIPVQASVVKSNQSDRSRL